MPKNRSSEQKRIGILLHPVRTYCRRVLRGITAVGAQQRWEWLLLSSDAHPPFDTLSGDFLHGVIGHFSQKSLVEQVMRANLPAVDIAGVRGDPDLPRVTTDDIAVGRLAATHLLSLGLANFAFFGTRPDYFSLLREQGFKQAIQAAGLSSHAFLDNGPAENPDVALSNSGEVEDWLRKLPKPIGL